MNITFKTGWRRNGLAAVLGVAATLTLSPFYIFPLLIPAFAGLWLLIHQAPTPKRAFLDGLFWGWGYHISGLYWISISLFTDPEKFAWLLPFSLLGLTGIIALYAALACYVTKKCQPRGVWGIWIFAAVWMICEYARGHVFTGFPWNVVGYSFGFSDATHQAASLVGVYGLTCLAVFLGAIPALLFTDDMPKEKARRAVAISYVCFLALVAWGAWRITPEISYVEDVTLRLVQPNIPQNDKWDPRLQRQGLETALALTRGPGIERITHVLWPETAIPYEVNGESALTHYVGSALWNDRAAFIGGALRSQGQNENWQIFNSIVALNRQGSIIAAYDKFKRVPFGEFLPFRKWIPYELMTPAGSKDFSRGIKNSILDIQGLRVRPLICYENIFPELSMVDGERPHALLTVTNDAWFGISTGPLQHFDMGRMRAVEQGVPLVQVGNTGISGVTDAFGRVLASTKLGEKTVVDTKLPMFQKVTVYNQYGRYFPFVIMILSFFGLIIGNKKTTNN